MVLGVPRCQDVDSVAELLQRDTQLRNVFADTGRIRMVRSRDEADA